MKERGQNSTLLADYKRDDFAEIYLFFDYDGHATLANDQKVDDTYALTPKNYVGLL